ncbi:MAG: peptidyl-prolyl cis-trans isomerase [Nitrospiraceae bacterium]|nr:MAG: peptidyl-prolyl cis-trans isomerase [Nitrospiraceae bacterium]
MTEQTINLAFRVFNIKAVKLLSAKIQNSVIAMSRLLYNSVNPLFFLLYPLLFVLFLFGCASLPHKSDILVLVDGEPVTTGDYVYSLEISHRREDMSSAQSLNLHDYLQKLIDDKLIVQEAKHMNMEEFPEVRQKTEAYILRESVTRLYDEEILHKVSVDEEDIRGYYRKNYERLTLSVIEANTSEEAEKILEQLRSGSNFSDMAKGHTPHVLKDQTEIVMTRNSLGTKFDESVASLKEGEFSGVIENGNKYYILKLISRQEAPVEDLEKIREKITHEAKQQMIKERSAEYLRSLRGSIKPMVHDDILSAIVFDGKNEARETWLKDERPLVEVEDTVLTAGAFTAMLSGTSRNKEAVLNHWLDKKLVDIEALRRQYTATSDLKDMARRYKEQILKNTFFTTVLVPKIIISDEDLNTYYTDHQDEFLKPYTYKIQQITLKTREEAQDIESSLKGGASFSWLAKTRSADSYALQGGDAGWSMKSGLPRPLQEIIDSMNPGDISSIIEDAEFYKIIMLQEKSRREPEDFSKVKSSIQAILFRKKFNELLSGYTDKLRQDAEIIMYPENLDSFEKGFKGGKN